MKNINRNGSQKQKINSRRFNINTSGVFLTIHNDRQHAKVYDNGTYNKQINVRYSG